MMTLTEILQQPTVVTKELILKLISLIDLTSLDSCDTTASISALIDQANKGFGGTYPAAVCTFSNYAPLLKQRLSPLIKSAVVGGYFPTGQALSDSKIKECELIAQTQVDEIDIVLNKGDFFDENFSKITNEITGIKAICGTTHLKVILETGDLKTTENIEKAAKLAINAGADFIKTSTGKTSFGASPEAVYTMCKIIKFNFELTGKRTGIKPSGGIRTIEDAITYYNIVLHVLGENWLNNTLFRIGASSLYNNLIQAYHKL